MTPILSGSGLNTFYGRSHILFDMGLEVRKGETVCLVGRNGAGKTTTFRSLMNLTPPRSGRIGFLGRECTGLPPYKMARLGLSFVPEDRRILAPFTVRENLEMGVIAERSGRWNMDTVLDCFPTLRRMLDRMGGALSGGEQQMLTIGRALMGNPEVLILDEPTEGLSPVIVGELKELVLRLKREGTTILLSEQNIRFALAVSDCVVVMDKGRGVFTGTVDAFRRDEQVQSKYLAV
ncbi:ABC transporter ATP-binding protein [Fundidesulfovibrio putealis]|uniref:ABC transporter ATP-binding protein n=1 Tax=Fundidesulfovibrio putealis TaxID=270496 RepID=UPI00040EAB82|nr:ABC transporter ATP-binding protein [Fundidesulfovibrio putealis]